MNKIGNTKIRQSTNKNARLCEVRLFPAWSIRNSIDCSLCCMPPRDWFTPHGSTTTWFRYSVTSIGYEFRSEMLTVWQYLLSAVNTVLHHLHCNSLLNSVQLQMTILGGGFDQQTRRRLSFRERSTRRLVTARFRSRRHESGTVCHLLSRRPHHWQYLSEDWRQSFSHAHTPTA